MPPFLRGTTYADSPGVDVTVAKDGQEAYDLVKTSMEESKHYDLIFMDVQVDWPVL